MSRWLLFLTGVAVGAAAGVIGSMKYFENKYHKAADDEIEEMRKYYDDLMGDIYPDGYHKDRSDLGEMVQAHEKKGSEEIKTGTDAKEVFEDEKLAGRFERVVYSDYFNTPDPADSEHPEEDDLDDEVAREMEEFDRRTKGRKPKIISSEAVGELPAGIDNQVLYFYTYDETICDDDNNVIEDYERILGDCIEQYDFPDSDERIIFVLNYELKVVYEIQKMDASWYEENVR